jgi:hypothetical protein
MLLGHWYLNTPTASGKPLEFVTTFLLIALAAELAFTILIGPSTAHVAPGATAIAPGTTIQTTGNGIQVVTPTAAPGQANSGAVKSTEARQAPLGPHGVYIAADSGGCGPLSYSRQILSICYRYVIPVRVVHFYRRGACTRPAFAACAGVTPKLGLRQSSTG